MGFENTFYIVMMENNNNLLLFSCKPKVVQINESYAAGCRFMVHKWTPFAYFKFEMINFEN